MFQAQVVLRLLFGSSRCQISSRPVATPPSIVYLPHMNDTQERKRVTVDEFFEHFNDVFEHYEDGSMSVMWQGVIWTARPMFVEGTDDTGHPALIVELIP